MFHEISSCSFDLKNEHCLEIQRYSSLRPKAWFLVANKTHEFLVDTGASISIIGEKLISATTFPVVPATETAFSVTGHPLEIVGQVTIPLRSQNFTYWHTFQVIRNSTKALIGMDFLKKYKVKIFCDEDRVEFQDDPEIPVVTLDVNNNILKDKTENKNQQVDSFAFNLKEVEIPPFDMRLVKCRSFLKGEVCTVATDFEVVEGLYGADRGHLRIPIFNSTAEPLVIKKGSRVAQVLQIETDKIFEVGSVSDLEKKVEKASQSQMKFIKENLKTTLVGEEKEKLAKLLQEFHDVISFTDEDIGHCSDVEHSIQLNTKEPFHLKQFRIPEAHLTFLNKKVTEMLKAKCLRTSKSAYNTPVFCVPKPHSNDPMNLRLVQDFRKLNKATVDVKYSIKEIRECIDTVGRQQSKIFSQLDLKNAFWQQNLEENSRQYTAFSVPGRGKFEFCSTPMGLKNSPHSFQRLMDHVFRDIPALQAYIDDLLLHTSDIHKHFSNLRLVLNRLRQHGLKLNLPKCNFITPEVTYLGHTLTAKGVKPAMDHIKAVEKFPEPQSIKQIREFNGLTNYFRPHIKNFSRLSGHLSALLKKSSGYSKGPLPPVAKKAFLDLKQQLCSAPLLAYPIPDKPYVLATDACSFTPEHCGGFGAVLSQVHDDGLERVVSYASRSLKDFERNYSAFLLENAAATWAIDHFHVYLAGRKFQLITDHKPLEKLSTIHTKTLNRLHEFMNKYDFDVAYRKGSLNGAPDALSRNPVDEIHFGNKIKLDKVKQEQKKDAIVCAIRTFLETGMYPKNKKLKGKVWKYAKQSFVKNDTLYYRFADNFSHKELLWIPNSLTFELITAFHADQFAGHFGQFKTVKSLQQFSRELIFAAV